MVLSLLSVAAAGYSTAPVPASTRAASPAMMAKSKVRFYAPRTARRVAEIRRNLRLRRCSPPLSRVQVAPMFDAPGELKGYVGEEDGFDPLKLSTFFDMKWLREAEVKHGRICMLAALGYTFVDATPIRLADKWVGVSSFKAHDANLGDFGGGMGQIFMFIAVLECFMSIPAINYTMNGGDREPGDYAFDPLGYLKDATPAQKEEWQLKELKNGRLAMLGFAGMVTQSALPGHEAFPYN